MTVHPKIKNEIRQIHQLISTTNEERVLLNAALIFYDIKEFPICMKTMLDAVPYSICHRLIFIQLSTKGYHNSNKHIWYFVYTSIKNFSNSNFQTERYSLNRKQKENWCENNFFCNLDVPLITIV